MCVLLIILDEQFVQDFTLPRLSFFIVMGIISTILVSCLILGPEELSVEVPKLLLCSLEQIPYVIVPVGHPDLHKNALDNDSSMDYPLMSGSQGAQQNSI
jgi:hypothetical protein